MQELTEIEKKCPICAQPNGCYAGHKNCWCLNKKVPGELLDLVPPHLKNKACICSTCIDKFTKNPEAIRSLSSV